MVTDIRVSADNLRLDKKWIIME